MAIYIENIKQSFKVLHLKDLMSKFVNYIAQQFTIAGTFANTQILLMTVAVYPLFIQIAVLRSTYSNYFMIWKNNSFTTNFFLFEINPSLAFDNISLLLIILSCMILTLSLISSWNSLPNTFFASFGFTVFIQVFILVLAFSCIDLILFYIAFEVILIPMFIMISLFGSRSRKVKASYFFMLYTIFGSFFFLSTLIFLSYNFGTTNYLILLNYKFDLNTQKLLWLGMFVSFAVKIPMIPFHIWLPEAHVEAPTPGSMILAGLLLKLGTYGFIRFSLGLFPEASIYFSPLIFILGLISIVYASFVAVRQTDMKKIIAYSSIAHMNLVVIGLFSFNVDCFIGSLFQMISHGFVSPGLFFLIGVLYSRYHTRLIYIFSGLNQYMPLFISFFLFFTMANISLPITSSFIGEFLIFIGLFETNVVLTLVSATSLVTGGLYMLWLFNRIAFGNLNSKLKFFGDLTNREIFILSFLGFFILFFGLKPDDLIFFMINDFSYLKTIN